jgi:DNA modification methylase
MEECVSRNLLKGDLDHTKFGSLLASYMKGEKDFDWAKIAEAFSVQEADLFKALKSSDDLQEFAKSLRPVDATPKAKPKQVPIPLRGDIWQLGNHRIICGDAANPDDIAKLMGDERARLIMVDPANAVDYEKAIQAKKGEQSAPDGGKQDDYTDLLTQILGNCLQFVLPRTAWYVWNADRKNVLDALQAVGILMHQQIVWIKPAALATRSFFSKQHESAFYGVKNGDKPVLNAEQVLAYVDHHDTGIFGWKKGDSKPLHHLGADRHLTSVWYADFDGKSGNGGSLPPTTKPVSLFHIPMLHHTDSGAVCLDPFAGSGTQIMAGESIGRRVFACEISPIFVEVAIRRWQNYMQLPAECLTREVAPPPIDKPNAQDK